MTDEELCTALNALMAEDATDSDKDANSRAILDGFRQVQADNDAMKAQVGAVERQLARTMRGYAEDVDPSGLIRVTGPGGFPVYAWCPFNQASWDGHVWDLPLFSSTGVNRDANLPMCPVEAIESCEVHFGRQEIVKMIDSVDVWDSNESRAPDMMGEVGNKEPFVMYSFQYDQDRKPKYQVQVSFGHNPSPNEIVDMIMPASYANRATTFVQFTNVLFQSPPGIHRP